MTFEFPVEWGLDLQSEHERYLTEQVVGGPVFIVNYPKEIKAFYMRLNDDGRTVAAMDLLVPKVGEIIGGSQREERLDLLTERMQRGGDRSGGALVVSRYPPLGLLPPCRLRPRLRAAAHVPDRDGEYPGRDTVSRGRRATRNSNGFAKSHLRRCAAAFLHCGVALLRLTWKTLRALHLELFERER